METREQSSFAQARLPWLVAAGAFIIYLATLSRTLSLMGVTGLARVTGWDWHPVNTGPLYYLLTSPIRWMPADWQLVATSAFSVICAVLVVLLLARSVALLPQDRTREQRSRELGPRGLLSGATAWIPPLFAVLVCGLQLSFWESATGPGSEMLDLLVFAYAIRCLLEYRISGQESWISKLALAYGLGVANNWAMIGFFPLFLIATVWIMGLSFFRYRFLLRTTLFGVAGLSLYLFLPAIQGWNDPVNTDFWKTLHANLATQRVWLRSMPRLVILLAAIASILPLFLIGIRWPSSMGDISAAGYAAVNMLMYVLHIGFFVLCLWGAFDSPLSPRGMSDDPRWGLLRAVPMLSFYYVAALCVGYFTGYFLVTFGQEPGKSWDRPSGLRLLANRVVLWLALAAAVVVPVGLVYRNLPQINARNSDELSRYGRRMAESLPVAGCAVLSDDPIRLYALRAGLGARGDHYYLLDTGSLSSAQYHQYLKRKYGGRLPEPTSGKTAAAVYHPSELNNFLIRLAAQSPVYYLHPSFGYFFEAFYQVPRGIVYEMRVCPTNSLEVVPLPAEVVKQEEDFWQKFDAEELPGLKAKVDRLIKLQKGELTPRWVGGYYSRASDDWGVRLQTSDLVDKAIRAYERALQLNPENPSAFVNLEWSRYWQKHGKPLDRYSDEAITKLNPYAGNWDLLLSINGPLDEPTFRMGLAQVMAANGLSRQAAQQMDRILTLTPSNMQAAVVLAKMCVQGAKPEQALRVVERIRSNPALMPKDSAGQASLIEIEAWVAYTKGEMDKADRLLRAAQDKYPMEDSVYFSLAQMYLGRAEMYRSSGKQSEYLRDMTNAVGIFEKQIKIQPENVVALNNFGGVYVQLEDFPRAIGLLSKAIELNPSNPSARLNRAIACLRAGRNDEARTDYEYLVKLDPASYRAYFGLGEVAYRKQEWALAVVNYENYLRHCPPNTAEFYSVQKRVAELNKKIKR